MEQIEQSQANSSEMQTAEGGAVVDTGPAPRDLILLAHLDLIRTDARYAADPRDPIGALALAFAVWFRAGFSGAGAA